MKPIKQFPMRILLLAILVLGACNGQPATAVATVPGSKPGTETAVTTVLYTTDIRPADFVVGITNPYLPLASGAQWVYEARLEDGSTERIEWEILDETRNVNGVTATILHDSVFVDGDLVEETFDWFAQDQEGNVWYLGEEVDNYENGVLVNHTGSWEWGKDGALPGVVMWANPAAHLNETYYQEYYAGEAEDQGQVLSVSESVIVPFGEFEDVVRTFDFSVLDPDLQEHKFYAAGVGLIKENDLLTGEEVMLISYMAPDTGN